jgi:D-alanine-D-alanine ligase
VPVPFERFIGATEPARGAADALTRPAFIKPNRGDGSLGITAASIVSTPAEAVACIERLRKELPGADLIAQEFLTGDEYGIGIIGNPDSGLDALPALEVDYGSLDPSLPRLLDYGSKTDPASPYWNELRFIPARIDPEQLNRMVGWCERLFRRLGIRDYGRFDFRTDATGVVKLMEVNPNPAWCHDGKLAHMASLRGERHSGLLRHIIEAARSRLQARDPRI